MRGMRVRNDLHLEGYSPQSDLELLLFGGTVVFLALQSRTY